MNKTTTLTEDCRDTSTAGAEPTLYSQLTGCPPSGYYTHTHTHTPAGSLLQTQAHIGGSVVSDWREFIVSDWSEFIVSEWREFIVSD